MIYGSRSRIAAILLGIFLGVPPQAAAQASDETAASEALREQTADQQVRHVLSRLTFGARPGDYERVREMGVDRWIAMQLEPRHIDDPTPAHLLRSFETLRLSTSELFRRYPLPAQAQSSADSAAARRAIRESQRLVAELQTARVIRAVTSERQLEEVMVDFWLNHFNVFANKGPERYYLAEYEREAIRPHALGSFRELLEAVAKSPAMLFYLDNWQSSVEDGRPRLADPRQAGIRRIRRRPGRQQRARDSLEAIIARLPRGLNENYARELLELHTLGVDGGYTQEDVVNVARAFTGWSLERPREQGGFVFRPVMHDAGEKVVLGNRLAAGRGMEDGEQVLDIVARHPSTARHIATKLARRFVSDQPPESLIDRAAETFTQTDGDIRETLRTIITSPEFFSATAYRAKVKSPFELVVSTLRALNAEPDTTVRTARVIAALGQPIYLHQAPNGYPETGDAWINTGTILNRINFGLAVAAGRMPGISLNRWPAAAELQNASRVEQIDGVIDALLGGEVSPDTRRILDSGVNPMLNVSGADTLIVDLDSPDEEDEMQRPRRRGRQAPIELDGLAEVLGLALGSPEFQRR
jgi:uncharacterized protein (DUF1800 family)